MCESVVEYLRKASFCPVPEVNFWVRTDLIDWLQLLLYGHEDAAVSFPRRTLVLCACSIILILTSGCKQAPWESLTPRYSDKNPPPSYSISSIETTQNLSPGGNPTPLPFALS
jgi:hypothetical protein